MKNRELVYMKRTSRSLIPFFRSFRKFFSSEKDYTQVLEFMVRNKIKIPAYRRKQE